MELREFQISLLEMLVEVDEILKKNNIPYFLVGGSVLGAIRHQGFIPWDDDIDIGFYPEDFKKMEKILPQYLSKHLMYCRIGENRIQNAPIGFLYRVLDSTEKLEEVPTIDFFKIDNVPEEKWKKKVQKVFSNVYHLCIYRKAAKNRGKKAYYFTKFILSITPNVILDYFQKLSNNIITYWNSCDTKEVCNLFGQKKYDKEIMPRDYIGTPILKNFEGHQFPVPEDWDKYLRHLYGEYMQYPKENERKPHHKEFQ